MGILAKKTQYKQLLCLYSKKTLNQLSPLKVSDPDVESFLAKADQEVYGVATVNFKVVDGVWQKTSSQPENLNFQPQFLTAEQRRTLLDFEPKTTR